MYSGKIKILPSILTSSVPISKKSRLVPIPEDTRIDIDESEQTDVTENYISNGWHWQWEEYEVDDSELEEGDVVYEYLTDRLLRLRETLTKKYVVCILNWVGFTCFIQNATCIV